MSEPITTLIADDEPLARRQLRSLLERDPQIALVGEAGSGEEARRAVRELRPELLLLDVRMPQGDGFSVLEDLADPPYVIFATAHAEHAVRAFDVAAVDYLLKPFDDERFERAMRRAKDAIRARRLVELAHDIAAPAAPSDSPESQRITVYEGRRISWINAADIEWIEAADYYANVHAHGRAHLVREPLQKLAERLGKRFLRVHRNALVNIARIQRIDRLEGGELIVVLPSGARVQVSRSRKAEVLRELGVR
ncbi:MAG TPA: LytTR family DNA-binding domain-containing protein [Steroidobacteraceae bacterium]|jgi:two-component system LytT family response regulator|nr:LytTR family DNA-binding domain-containing protein [Steroidobacteraceae bacterium]